MSTNPSSLIFRVDDGGDARLGRLLHGAGGEADIYEVIGRPDLVAKLYRADDAVKLKAVLLEKEAKVCAMLARPPEIHSKYSSIAWPVSSLRNRGTFVGFLMPHVQGETLFRYHNPKQRCKHSPNFNWLYLHRTASNLCVIADAIHRVGHVIADVNDQNFIVQDNALVAAVDTDSFQVQDAAGRWHLCGVGTPEFTPPELQGKPFSHNVRGPEQDRFGIAVLIFQLLMEGSHPFRGRLSLSHSVPEAQLYCILHGHFPYDFAFKNPAQPPKNALDFQILHPLLQNLFRRCFVDGHLDPMRRPSASEWRNGLQRAEAELTSCKHGHKYHLGLAHCPWCHRFRTFRSASPVKSQPINIPSPAIPPTARKAPSPPFPILPTQTPPASPRRKTTPPVSKSISWRRLAALFAWVAIFIGVFRLSTRSPLNSPPEHVVKQSSTQEYSLTNGLGMKFVPVPIIGGPTNGQRILFSVWDTRVQDYESFARETGRSVDKPDFAQMPSDPVVNVSWEDATAFCEWLSKKEGRFYRLPSDHEWSCAVGIGKLERAEQTPVEKNGKIAGYPWGVKYPPPENFGNYAPSLKVDQFANTSPVGSFPANEFGLFDMGGNVWQWCEDWLDPTSKRLRVLRGGAWSLVGEPFMRSSARVFVHPSGRYVRNGFRCVLVVLGEGISPIRRQPSEPAPSASTRPSAQAPGVSPATATVMRPFVNSLGMRFVPVPIIGGSSGGKRLLFAVWNTRVVDYAVFARESGRPIEKPTFAQGPSHPVVNVNWEDATMFCEWLSKEEGRLYRLPSDHEWSCACGIGSHESAEQSPYAKSNAGPVSLGSWMPKYPPPWNFGNYAPSLMADDFANTSPVGSFPPNEFGLFDMSGNVWQWCEDWYDVTRKEYRVLRGGSWVDLDERILRPSYREFAFPTGRFGYDGFRCVLVLSDG